MRGLSVLLMAATAMTSAVALAVAQNPVDRGQSSKPGEHLARTAWGDPDLQGIWSSSTRPFKVNPDRPLREGDTGAGPEHWYESTPIANISQLTIVDPPDHKVPALTAKGAERLGTRTQERERRATGPLDFSPWDRCITRGVPGSMVPITYNNNYQFFQTR